MIAHLARRGGQALIVLTLMAIAVATYVVMQVRYGGPIVQRQEQQASLIADVLPPPLFVVEPYLDTTLALSDPDKAEAIIADLANAREEYVSRREYWRKAEVPAQLRPAVDQAIGTAQQFWDVLDNRFIPALKARNEAEMRRIHDEQLAGLYQRQHDDVQTLVKATLAFDASMSQHEGRTVSILLALAGFAALAVIVALAAFGRLVRGRIVTPLEQRTAAITRLAAGDFASQIEGLDAADELGEMARAKELFRTAGADRKRTQAEQKRVVEVLSRSLDKLASQDLECRILEPFPGLFAKLGEDFNRAIDALSAALGSVRVGAAGVMGSITEIRAASDDLARRNESQAANLEETSATMSKVSAGLTQTAGHAAAVQKAVSAA